LATLIVWPLSLQVSLTPRAAGDVAPVDAAEPQALESTSAAIEARPTRARVFHPVDGNRSSCIRDAFPVVVALPPEERTGLPEGDRECIGGERHAFAT